MVDDRSVAEQIHEIINLEHALTDVEMKCPEKFLAKTGQTTVNMIVGGSSGASTSRTTEGPSVEGRRSKRARVVKNFGSDIVTYNIEDDPVTFKDAMASSEAKKLSKMDVKTTFLYGALEEEIYMNQPERFVAHGSEHKVCKVVKSLYGLKQAP
ncbi:Retrovirus-related Pol polyprotein from transposon TNT 1-94 [Sesamum angolense]|uniref:Retrovirus-related Pol polyprotein from transposon TNT 1-94 n=1 Tax=Sesamum angolense TaxID=2727404 RepID=A0AAE1WJI8_9LAMI|nr:Retrovirus-related Pol polyprotein from transposon TNT 1-94 [Sesamum angolense]